MDWSLEQKRQEKMKVSKKPGGDKNVNMMVAIEREFAQIFGTTTTATYSDKRGKAGDHVRRSEIAQGRKY